MGIMENLHELQREATGAAAAAIAGLVSLPHAVVAGLADSIRGKSFNDASGVIMAQYAKIGRTVGREQSDEIVRALVEAHTRRSPH